MRPTTKKLRTRLALIALALATAAATTLPTAGRRRSHPDSGDRHPGRSAPVRTRLPGRLAAGVRSDPTATGGGRAGVFRSTFTVPAGNYAYKVALNGSWDENYGAGGTPGGADLPLTAPGTPITFTYNHATHLISDDLPKSVTAEQAAHWVRRTVIAWNLPDQRDGFSYRLYWAAEGGLVNDDGEITGGQSVPLNLIPSGLSAAVRRDFPHLAAYEALRVPASARSQIPEILTGQIAVASFDAAGDLVSATGVQLPGVLDHLYRGAQQRRLGPVWRAGRPTLSVWAPTAKTVSLLLDPVGAASETRVTMRRDADGVWSVRGRPGWRNASYLYEVTVYAPTTGAVEVNRVTDPYSLALTTNSERSVLVNLKARALKPAGWNRLKKPKLAQAGVLDHLRAPRARLLDQRRDGARRPSRHLPGLHRPRQ